MPSSIIIMNQLTANCDLIRSDPPDLRIRRKRVLLCCDQSYCYTSTCSIVHFFSLQSMPLAQHVFMKAFDTIGCLASPAYSCTSVNNNSIIKLSSYSFSFDLNFFVWELSLILQFILCCNFKGFGSVFLLIKPTQVSTREKLRTRIKVKQKLYFTIFPSKASQTCITIRISTNYTTFVLIILHGQKLRRCICVRISTEGKTTERTVVEKATSKFKINSPITCKYVYVKNIKIVSEVKLQKL